MFFKKHTEQQNMLKISLVFKKNTNINELITHEFLRLRIRNFQGIMNWNI